MALYSFLASYTGIAVSLWAELDNAGIKKNALDKDARIKRNRQDIVVSFFFSLQHKSQQYVNALKETYSIAPSILN